MVLGKILKPHGVKGEVKMEPYADSYFNFKKIKKITVGERAFDVTAIRGAGNFLFMKIDGVDSVDDAEALRGCVVSYDREDAPSLPNGRFYIDDIVGCSVVSDGVFLGKVVDVLQNGSADVFCVEGDKNFMFPFLKGVVDAIDVKNKEIKLNPSESKKVIVYED